MLWLEEDFVESCDFDVIGIGCAAGPHRLGWELNRRFGWGLAFHHIIHTPQRQGNSEHLVYKGLDVMLVLNRHAEGTLVRAGGVTRLDYLLRLAHCDDREEDFDVNDIAGTIRSMPLVTLATVLDASLPGIMEHLAVLDTARGEDELH
jgi:hypothetical protein